MDLVRFKTEVPFTSNSSMFVIGEDGEFTFNNVMYKMEAKDSLGNDVRDSSFDKVELSNEYQKSGIRDLVLGKNLKRKNRTWSVVLPREQNSMNRIKSPWVLLTLSIDNSSNLSINTAIAIPLALCLL